MTFQFLCPQGHLLEGDEAHQGMQCQCPQCGTSFLIPVIEAAAHASDKARAKPSPPPPPADVYPMAASPAVEAPPRSAPPLNVDLGELGLDDLNKAASADLMLHIPCPNGHELETPPEMVGQRAICPHCKAEFRLRREQSVEYQREQEMLDRQRGKFWFQMSIIAASFVVVVLLVIFALMIFA